MWWLVIVVFFASTAAATQCLLTTNQTFLASLPTCDDSFSDTPCGWLHFVCASACDSTTPSSPCFHHLPPCTSLHLPPDLLIECEASLPTLRQRCDITEEYAICGGWSQACAMRCPSSFIPQLQDECTLACYNAYLPRTCVLACGLPWVSECIPQSSLACYMAQRDTITDACSQRCESPSQAPMLHQCLTTTCNVTRQGCQPDSASLCDTTIDTPGQYRSVCSTSVLAQTCALGSDQCEMSCSDWARTQDCMPSRTTCFWQSSVVQIATLTSACNAVELSGCDVNTNETAVSCTISNCQYSQLNTTQCTLTNCLCNRTDDPTIRPCVGRPVIVPIQLSSAGFTTVLVLMVPFIFMILLTALQIYQAVDPIGLLNQMYPIVTPEPEPVRPPPPVPKPPDTGHVTKDL